MIKSNYIMLFIIVLASVQAKTNTSIKKKGTNGISRTIFIFFFTLAIIIAIMAFCMCYWKKHNQKKKQEQRCGNENIQYVDENKLV